MANRRPRLFIGSSTEGKGVADAVDSRLRPDIECTIWNTIFGLGTSTLTNLFNRTRLTDFSVFIFSADDLTEKRGELFKVPRDNVILELGLFAGAIGPERCFFLAPEKARIQLPTD